jgi:hypothetical protein
MKRIAQKTQWFLTVAACLALSGAVAGISAARTVTLRPAPTSSTRSLPLPALDRVVAKLAAEARTRTHVGNAGSEIR